MPHPTPDQTSGHTPPTTADCCADPRRWRLTVSHLPGTAGPRLHPDNLATLVFLYRRNLRRYNLPFEGPFAAPLSAYLNDRQTGSTEGRLRRAKDLLYRQGNARVVTALWGVFTRGLPPRLHAAQQPPDPAAVVIGIAYVPTRDTHGVETTPERASLAITDEVTALDRWLHDEVHDYRLEQRDEDDRWVLRDHGILYGPHARARLHGENLWRHYVGDLYTEAEPTGPHDAGHVGGDIQLSDAWTRRFRRRLTDGEHWGVIDVECYLARDPDCGQPCAEGDTHKVLMRTLNLTVCTDPDDPGSTELNAYTHHDVIRRYADSEPEPTAADARALCAEFDPSPLDWDGTPL